MKFETFGILLDGSEDSIVIEGQNINEIREKSTEETSKRQWKDCWSKELTD